MGGTNATGDAIESAAFLARSEHRVRVLELLADDRRTREELMAGTDVTRVTLSRILGDLGDRDGGPDVALRVAARDRLGAGPHRTAVYDPHDRAGAGRHAPAQRFATRREDRPLARDVRRARPVVAAGIAILPTAAAIAVAGLVGFVGLIVPHVVRNLVGGDTKRLLVGCLFVGPALLVGADVGARLALNPVQLPVGIVTGLVGGPYFLYLMRKRENMGEI